MPDHLVCINFALQFILYIHASQYIHDVVLWRSGGAIPPVLWSEAGQSLRPDRS